MEKYIKTISEFDEILNDPAYDLQQKKIISKYQKNKIKLMFVILNYMIKETYSNWKKCIKCLKNTYLSFLKYASFNVDCEPTINLDDFLLLVNKIRDLVVIYKQEPTSYNYEQIMECVYDLNKGLDIDVSEIAKEYIDGVVEVSKSNLNSSISDEIKISDSYIP